MKLKKPAAKRTPRSTTQAADKRPPADSALSKPKRVKKLKALDRTSSPPRRLRPWEESLIDFDQVNLVARIMYGPKATVNIQIFDAPSRKYFAKLAKKAGVSLEQYMKCILIAQALPRMSKAWGIKK